MFLGRPQLPRTLARALPDCRLRRTTRLQNEYGAVQRQGIGDESHDLRNGSLEGLETRKQLADVVQMLQAPMRPLEFNEAVIALSEVIACILQTALGHRRTYLLARLRTDLLFPNGALPPSTRFPIRIPP